MEKTSIIRSMKKLIRDLAIVSGLFILTGFACMIFPDVSGLVICYIIGGAIAVFGILRSVIYFASDRTVPFGSFAFVQGIALLVLGVYFLVRPQVLQGILMTLFAILLITDGVMKIQYSVDLLRIGARRWWVLFVCSLLAILFGVAVLLEPFESAKGLMIFSGICMVFDGGFDVFALFYMRSKIPTETECTEICGKPEEIPAKSDS